jgi:hypothetical protein
MSGNARRAENSVIVLPEPGGPHKTVTEENNDFTTCTIYMENFRVFLYSSTNVLMVCTDELPLGAAKVSTVWHKQHSNCTCSYGADL